MSEIQGIVRIDLSKFTNDELVEFAKQLNEENIGLKIENARLTQRLHKEVTENQDRATANHLLVENIGQLKAYIAELEKENIELKAANSALSERLATTEASVVTLTERVAKLESEHVAPISIREAMRLLERWICFNAVNKSKTKFKTDCFNFDKIKNCGDQQIQTRLAGTLSSLNLRKEHLNMLAYLKDCGDYVAHSPSNLSLSEWTALASEEESSELDEEDLKLVKTENSLKRDLFAALSSLLGLSDSGQLLFSDPIEKPKGIPVSRCH